MNATQGWNWQKRTTLDRLEHRARCEVCRQGRKPKPGEHLFAVKDAATRAFIHVVACSTEEAQVRSGFASLLYSFCLDLGAGPPMPEAVKARLRVLSEQRRIEARKRRTESEARP